jgi:ribonuclease D
MEFIQTGAALKQLTRDIAGSALLAIDTEAAGYHRYEDRICLVQLSTRQRTAVIDTLALPDIAPLASPLSSATTEVVLHDAEYDLRLLARDHGITITNLFDTKIAAQFLGEPRIGLGDLAEKHLGVKMDKKHQRADWAQRPLREELLAYAAEDTRHLPALRDRLRAMLGELGRLHWAQEEFQRRAHARWAESDDDETFRRLKNTRDFSARQLGALRELYAWREDTARDRDVAPFRVISNDALVEVARAMPESTVKLARVPAMGAPLAHRYGDALLDAVARARALDPTELPQPIRRPRRPPPDPDFERRVDRLRAERDRQAEALGIDRGFLMPRPQLEEIARAMPKDHEALGRVADVREWQVEALGRELVQELRKTE